MKIYFAGSIKAGREDVLLYEALIDHLKTYGVVLTEHVGSYAVTHEGSAGTPQQIHDQDFQWILQADVLVAEITTPSLGVGYEIGRAVERRKKILCLYRKKENKSVSSMIIGSPFLSIREYVSLKDAKSIIDSYIQSLPVTSR